MSLLASSGYLKAFLGPGAKIMFEFKFTASPTRVLQLLKSLETFGGRSVSYSSVYLVSMLRMIACVLYLLMTLHKLYFMMHLGAIA